MDFVKNNIITPIQHAVTSATTFATDTAQTTTDAVADAGRSVANKAGIGSRDNATRAKFNQGANSQEKAGKSQDKLTNQTAEQSFKTQQNAATNTNMMTYGKSLASAAQLFSKSIANAWQTMQSVFG